ncbi:MAG: spore germination protein GerW family protein [Pseudonocardiaceae bacterium]
MAAEQATNVQDFATRIREVIGASKVFGEPIERNGVTVIPVAKVAGGGGGGSGSDPQKGQGFGGGLGWGSRPTGVYVLRDGEVSWRPAVDVNQVVLAGATVVITALLTLRTLVKMRTKRHG